MRTGQKKKKTKMELDFLGLSMHAHTYDIRAHTNCMRMHTRTLQVFIRMQVACACIHTRNPKPKKPEQKTKKTQ